jgi:hypothetical protein
LDLAAGAVEASRACRGDGVPDAGSRLNGTPKRGGEFLKK